MMMILAKDDTGEAKNVERSVLSVESENVWNQGQFSLSTIY
jgi:hypothetical protein